ncbi:hypothetical protein GCM10010300_78820 [Streptomyces olivaceoviridis]|uniref:hypothetical protein n=1 Tax=Streptomyces olivaceoviridis TaxID=1921 RepID=UPI001677160E|nr:hypothetical protein [Streptomyces olivaceoviridis]GGZ23482.1 hypothetical protein GCM10010300_78820 [Streptomyces olivaceoviridis]
MTDKQHKDDLHRVSQQNTVTDIVRGIEDGPRGGFLNGMVRSVVETTPFGRAVAARSDFDKRDLDLNQMIDLVERTDPEDLESSGKALWDARDAIKKAADDLKAYIDKVPWVGVSGDQFRTWGENLVTNTHHLSEFAGAAGDQITAAAVGLAAVRGGMPARDTRANPKRPEKFTEAEKAANKTEYDHAVQVEKHRQEAINQMNRLASYYAVSEEVLAALPAKAPNFTSMPDVGVPRPSQRFRESSPTSGTGSHTGTGSAPAIGHHTTAVGADNVAHHVTNDTTPHHAPTTHSNHTVQLPEEPSVGTNIDSTGTLPPPTTTHTTGPTPPVTGTPPAGGQPDPLGGTGYRVPLPNPTSGRSLSGSAGYRNPPFAQGRAGTAGPTNPQGGPGRTAAQGPMNQTGRATSTGQPAGRGTASPVGRAVTGGTPRPGGTAAPRGNATPTTGAGRSNGVVGGRPTATGGPAKGGTRIPRGTVIGAEGQASSQSTAGRLGQRGVFGAPESAARPGAKPAGSSGSRTGAGVSDVVTGRPTGRNSAAGAERNGMTRGGAGLVRGAGRKGKAENGDEETQLPEKPRRDVPPVAN